MQTDLQDRIEDLEDIIKDMSKIAIPIAVQRTLNETAFEAMQQGRKNASDMFTERNTWTKRSIVFEKTQRTLEINKMASHMGSTADYMRHQETGGQSYDNIGGINALIPTGKAAGQGDGPRTKKVRKSYYKDAVKPTVRKQIRRMASVKSRFTTPAQRAIATMIEAKRAKEKFWFGSFPINRNPQRTDMAVYSMVGGTLNRNGSFRKYPRFNKLYVFRVGPQQYKSSPWMEKAANKEIKKMPQRYFKQLGKQVEFLAKKKGVKVR